MDKAFTLENYFKQNVSPLDLPNKDELYNSVLQIENSMTERLDVLNIANIFILEASQLLANSIYLFENGYFDASFYSIRQSIELATTMMYFADNKDDNTKKKALYDWKKENRFPMTKQMLSELKIYGEVVANMYTVMPSFFADLDILYAKINKIVHKQGYDYL